MNIKAIKADAKENLKGNYGPFVLSILVFILLNLCAWIISTLIGREILSTLLMVIVYALLGMGFIHMVMKISKKETVKFDDLLSQTDYFLKFLGIYVILAILGAVIGLLEGITIKSLLVVIQHSGDFNIFISTLLIFFGMALSLVILVFSIYVSIVFSQVLFIFYENPKEKIVTILTKSFEMMEGRVLEYAILCLSFLGWIILGVLTLGILYIWLFPYIAVTLANYYNAIKDDNNIEEVTIEKIEEGLIDELEETKTDFPNTFDDIEIGSSIMKEEVIFDVDDDVKEEKIKEDKKEDKKDDNPFNLNW